MHKTRYNQTGCYNVQMDKEKPKMVRIVFEVPEETRWMLRQVAAKRRRGIRDLLIDAIRAMAKEDGIDDQQQERPKV